jgi:hypothetical protein
MKPAAFLSACFLALVSLGHLLRVVYSIRLVVGDVTVPMSLSVLATLGTGVLAVLLWREQRRPT